MAADVQERPQLPVVGPRHDDRDVAGAAGEVGPELADLPFVPDVLPGAPEDRFLLPAQDLGLEIPIPGECSLHPPDDISVQCALGTSC
jgi:hypothetical protein